MNPPINQNEIDSYTYSFDKPLRLEQFHNSRMIMSETNNLMPDFVGSLFHYQRQVYDNK
jgi:hypothetical protein